MLKLKFSLLLCLGLAWGPLAHAQRQMEKLGRGMVAMRTGASSVYVGWRLLGTDPADTKFNLYRVTGGVTNLLVAGLTNSCNYVDNGAASASAHAWFVQPVINGATQANSAAFAMPAAAPNRQYLNIPLTPPPAGVAYDGVPYTYNANDCSVGDVDGDGEYEIILKWDPSNSQDNSFSGFTGNTFLDCYKLDGTRLWRFDLGPNIRSGAHYMDFMVYDFDGDGKAELMCRTAPGSRDGLGNYVGGLAKWQTSNGPHPAFNDTDDYRFNNPNGVTNGYVLHGPEFMTVFNGLTGEELATTTFYPKRDQDNNDDNPSASRINAIWGDSYGNRLDRFLAGVAFCDGVRPSAIFCRGYYTRAFLTAWDWRNGQLTKRWVFDSNNGPASNLDYRGQGAHSLSVGDVDGDGKDEIVFGACVIDDNGQGLYSTGLGHGDAEHYSDMDPQNPGSEIWFVHETPSAYGPYGLECHEAKTGNLIFGYNGTSADVGRGVAYDIDPRYRGYETWGAGGVLKSVTGVQITSSRPSQMNFCSWWDADTLRESLDGTTIYKWDWNASANNSIFSTSGLSSNNGTKSTPCLSGDIFGDWREEVIWRTSDNLNLRIYTTTIVATNRLYTLMHDPQYRCAIAWQNTGYNQPPHPGFFLGYDMYAPPVAPISDAALAWRGGNGGDVWDVANNWFTNGIWTNNTVASFATGNSVLFDLRASNHTAITISATVTPGDIKVQSPADFTFTGNGVLAGAAKLIKAGPGRLTLANTNTFTGGTFVSGGQLIVNGALPSSTVVVEARGEPWGRARIGGGGILGQGLTVQRDCGVIVGPGTNAAGTLTVTNGVVELGGVLNQFDLSNDPSGATRTNDRVTIIGNLTLTGTNTIEITQPDGALGAGLYPLFTYTGTLSGGLSNLTLSGNFIQPVMLTNPPGQIALLAAIPASSPLAPSNLIATGVGAFQINLAWTDNSTDETAFVLERATGSPTVFAPIAVLPPDTTNYPNLGLSAATTYFYRVRGTNLAGFTAYSNTNGATTSAEAAAVTWRGDGTANLWDLTSTPNWSDGFGLVVFNNNSDVIFDQTGSNNIPATLVGVLQPDSVTVNATKNYTFSGAGALTSPGRLTKAGSGTLTLANTGTNLFTDGVYITSGTLALNAVQVLGSSSVNLQSNATLALGTYTLTTGNPLIVSGTPTVTGGNGGGLTDLQTVSGNGVLNISVNTGVLDFEGSWAGFNGKVQFSGANIIRFNNSTGSATTEYNLGNGGLSINKRTTSAGTIALGALGGGPNATLQGASGGGNSSATTYSIGGKNLNATYSGAIINGQGTVSITKTGNGTQTFSGTNTYTGATTVSAGTLLVNGNQSAATGPVSVSTGATLGGDGVIGGTVTVNGTLSPGTTLGKLTLNSGLTLNANSTARFEFTRVPLTNDSLEVAGTVLLNGTLQAVNLGLEAPVAGDHFKLLTAGTVTGSFASLDLPDLDAGLDWSTNRLTQDGTLWVVLTTPPAIRAVAQTGGQFAFSGTGGTPGWNYFVLSATNVAQPVDQWARLATNQFTAGGGFAFTNNAALAGQRFFRILSE